MEIKKIMGKQVTLRSLIIVIVLAGLFLSGCDDDKRLTEMAQEAANRQAEQNKEMAQQNQRIAEATKELVQADAQARKEQSAMHKDLRADQLEVGKQRDQLEAERKQIAAERKWDQLLALAIEDLGVLLVIAAIVGFCWYLLMGLRHETVTDQAVGELLIQEIVAENPILLPSVHTSQSALEHPRIPAIPAIKECKPDSSVSKK
jgi:hypothetical protein